MPWITDKIGSTCIVHTSLLIKAHYTNNITAAAKRRARRVKERGRERHSDRNFTIVYCLIYYM